MQVTTIYRINEKDRTIDIAQSVKNNDEDLRAAVLNTRIFTFDELMNQHILFRKHTEVFENFRNRLNSALRTGRSISIDTDDMIGRFLSEYGENIFFKGFVSEVIERYDSERQVLLKPNDILFGTIAKSKIQTEIAEKINALFDEKLKLICKEAYFNYNINMDYFSVQSSKIIIVTDEYTFNVFHESDNALFVLLADLGQIVHHNRWTVCKCGFCHKFFLAGENEVCCEAVLCKEAQKEQKELIYRENTKEYSQIKKTYDSYVRRYKGYLTAAHIDTLYPADYDEFIQAKEEKQADMDKLKKKLIRNGLPTKELYELGERYKKEIKSIVEKILEKRAN